MIYKFSENYRQNCHEARCNAVFQFFPLQEKIFPYIFPYRKKFFPTRKARFYAGSEPFLGVKFGKILHGNFPISCGSPINTGFMRVVIFPTHWEAATVAASQNLPARVPLLRRIERIFVSVFKIFRLGCNLYFFLFSLPCFKYFGSLVGYLGNVLS